MTTRAVMVARIGSEIRRPSLTAQITDAITSAIAAYEDQRLIFTESRALTFSTVANQEFYTEADSALIPRLESIDYVKIMISDYPRDLIETKPSDVETLNRNGTQTGEPIRYCYFNQNIRLAYIPSDVWTVRIGGVVRVPGPASDVETGNPWMTTAEALIRCRAKYELYTHVLFDDEKADRFSPENEASPTAIAYRQLRGRTNRLQGGSMIMEGCW